MSLNQLVRFNLKPFKKKKKKIHTTGMQQSLIMKYENKSSSCSLTYVNAITSRSHRIGLIATVASSLFPSMTLTVGSPHSAAKTARLLVFIAPIDRDRFA